MPLFTRENARENALKANRVRWSRERSAAAQPAIVPPVPIPIPVAEDTFTTRKLARVRGQIDRVEQLLDDADEPQAVDRFANALTRLYDLERVLAGRPLPGSRRPANEPKGRQSWVDAQPTVPQPHVPTPSEPAVPSDSPTVPNDPQI